MRVTLVGFWLAAMLVVAGAAEGQERAGVEAGFRNFLKQEIWPEAQRLGVPRRVFDAALAEVKPNLELPDLVLPGETGKVDEIDYQAEFRSPSAYFNEKRLAGLAAEGQRLLRKHEALLSRIEQRYGVPGPILVAIWGRESGFGTARMPHDAFEVLATKAYLSRRRDMFRAELLAALQIVAEGDIGVRQMRSSWAGAMGQPQFMPSKFRTLAVDFDGDGKRDIWNSVPDTLASIANYLRDAGWTAGRDWGFEANVPAAVSCTLEGPDKGRPIAEFVAAGVTRVSGRPFPQSELNATGHLLRPAGRQGPGFIATPNFYVLKAYNNSDLYALFVGHAADRMQGGGRFRGGWAETSGLTRGDVARLQEKLQSLGYDVGGADGLAGFKTRRSIGEWQAKAGLQETCWPSRELAARL